MSKCKVLISRGKNNGMVCGDVCKQCRHVVKSCLLCNKTFNRDTAYFNHIKICPKKIKPTIILREGTDLYKKINIMEQQLLQLSKKPNTIVNNYSVTYQHIAINEVGAFKALCDKMGINEATDFLCQLATKPQVMSLFEKLYLDCDPSNYPITNNNGKDFLYRDANDKIVHDIGGLKIAQLGERLMKNTFLEAADPLLKRFVKQNEGDHDGDDNDYDRFRELQNGAFLTKNDKTFIKDLYPKTYNPNHAFFIENK